MADHSFSSFKRQRMNWPQDYPGVKHEEEPLSPSTSKPMFSLGDLAGLLRTPSAAITLPNPVSEADAIPIRRIRAYVARKV